MTKKIGIIGIGNMGGAIYSALVKILPMQTLAVCDGDKLKLKKTKAKKAFIDPNQLIANSDIVILAVKPQTFFDLAKQISVDCKNKIFISIMAGISIKKISQQLKSKKIIRTMPNLPATVLSGVTGCYFPKNISPNEKNFILKILNSFGEVVLVKKEDDLNKITALSGSGPAYFYYFCELLEQKARSLGFSSEVASKLAVSTFVGSANLLKQSGKTATQLRLSVTSPGGTTAAAISSLEKTDFAKIFFQAMEKALIRAKELNQ